MKSSLTGLVFINLAGALISQSSFAKEDTNNAPWLHVGAVSVPRMELNNQRPHGGLSVAELTGGSVHLQCAFQRLDGEATAEGLWMVSTTANAKGTPFRIMARALGREDVVKLEPSGQIKATGQIVQLIRPMVTEEYLVSIDGVRQDFVITKRPPGDGLVRLILEVGGASSEAFEDGVILTLEDGGRRIVYNHLGVRDSRGHELKAKIELVSVNRLAVVLDDAGAEYPLRIDPTFSDANWVSLSALPGVNGTVYAAVADNDGDLYVGGQFTVAGNVLATNVAKWNGSAWSALGSGLSGSDYGGVSALALSGNNLFAGGYFTTAGGRPANYIARWDGTNWWPLGSGVSGGPYGTTVNALAVSGTNLFVGGYFTQAGDVPANYIAQWNGTSWSALGSGVLGEDKYNNGPAVYALAVAGTNVFVGGYFTNAGTVAATNIAQWNGNSWSALGLGIPRPAVSPEYFVNGLYVSAMAVVDTNLYVAGGFPVAGLTPASCIAKWDGSSWSALGSGITGGGPDGNGPFVSCLAAVGTNLFVGGDFSSAGGVPAVDNAQWNGSSWSALAQGIRGRKRDPYPVVWAMATSGSNVFIGGDFSMLGGVSENNIAQRNGDSWSPLGQGIGGDVNALVIRDNNLYVGGIFSFRVTDGEMANNIAEWNGSSWLTVGSGTDGDVNTLALWGTNLVAGGAFTNAGNVQANNIAQWNGNSWSGLGSGVYGISHRYDFAPYVSSLAVAGSNLFVGGKFNMAGSNLATNVAQWNGFAWAPLGIGIDGDVNALAASGNGLYGGGSFAFITTNGATANNIAEWDGSAWSALGSGISGSVEEPGGYALIIITFGPEVYSLAVSGTNLYVGGVFTSPGNGVAQWNGNSWSALGSGVDSGLGSGFFAGIPTNFYSAYALAIAEDSSLIVGGYFSNAGGSPASHIARWDGSSWSPLGSGASGGIFPSIFESGSVLCLALDHAGNLHLGGDFTAAGTNVSAFLAKALMAGPVPESLSLSQEQDGTNVLTFLGTPGVMYAIDLATNLAAPIKWVAQSTNLAATANAATAGYVSTTNSSPLPQAYYRTRLVQ